MITFKDKISLLDALSSLDWIIFGLVLIITFSSVFFAYSKKHDPNNTLLDNLLMSRQLTLPLFIATLVSTWYGGIFGVTQIAFNNGIYNFVTQGLFWYITYIIFSFFIVEKIYHSKAITLPDLISKMFGPNSGKLGAILTLTNVLPIAYIISLGLFIQSLFSISLELSMLVGLLVVLSYSSWGGFRSVVYSDLIQFIVMCLSVFLVLIFSISLFGTSYLKVNLPSSYFSFSGNHSLGETLSWGLIALSTLIDPNFYQRCFAASSAKNAKKGILISTLIWIVFDLSTTFGAMYAKATLPEASSGQAYLIYALQLLPHGLRGFFLAGILATILSTLDSFLFLSGSTLSIDLRSNPLKHKNISLSIIMTGFLSYSFAIFFEGNIKLVWKLLGSFSASGMLLPILYGYKFPKRLKDNEFLLVALVGISSSILWRISSFHQSLDEVYLGMMMSFLTLFFLDLKKRFS